MSILRPEGNLIAEVLAKTDRLRVQRRSRWIAHIGITGLVTTVPLVIGIYMVWQGLVQRSAGLADDEAANQEKDSIVYICMTNSTGNRAYVSGDDQGGKSFEGNVEPGGVYLVKYRRGRGINRNIKIWVNGQEQAAKYKWTWLPLEKLTADKACYFNKWSIKEGPGGLAYLEYASQQTD